jgi:hypothetical protein
MRRTIALAMVLALSLTVAVPTVALASQGQKQGNGPPPWAGTDVTDDGADVPEVEGEDPDDGVGLGNSDEAKQERREERERWRQEKHEAKAVRKQERAQERSTEASGTANGPQGPKGNVHGLENALARLQRNLARATESDQRQQLPLGLQRAIERLMELIAMRGEEPPDGSGEPSETGEPSVTVVPSV